MGAEALPVGETTASGADGAAAAQREAMRWQCGSTCDSPPRSCSNASTAASSSGVAAAAADACAAVAHWAMIRLVTEGSAPMEIRVEATRIRGGTGAAAPDAAGTSGATWLAWWNRRMCTSVAARARRSERSVLVRKKIIAPRQSVSESTSSRWGAAHSVGAAASEPRPSSVSALLSCSASPWPSVTEEAARWASAVSNRRSSKMVEES